MLITPSTCPSCGKKAAWPKWNLSKRSDDGFGFMGLKCSQCGHYEEQEMRPVGWPPAGTLAVSHERRRK